MFLAIQIAEYLVRKGLKENKPLTMLQVIKLAFISEGYMLALSNGNSLFEDPIEAWKYGPVIPSIYEAYKKYGSRSIRQEKDLDISNIEGNSYLTKFLDHMFEKYSKFTGSELIALTHKEGTPWKQVYKPNIPHIEIERERIQSYYEDLLNCG